MTENRPTITVEQFAELCRMVHKIADERPVSNYIEEKEWTTEAGPKRMHKEWALYILGQLGLGIQPGENPGEFLKAMGISTYP